MKQTYKLALSAIAAAALIGSKAYAEAFDPAARAEKHSIVSDAPGQNFFHGGLIGNGGMGVVVHTRPDSVLLYMGHNNVWDIRAEEVPMSKLGKFEELWGKYKNGDKSWLKEYNAPADKAYANSYPRPAPCGTLILTFDRRDVRLLGHTVHLKDGVCDVRFLVKGRPQTLQIMADMGRDRVWMRMIDEAGDSVAGPFHRAALHESGKPDKEVITSPQENNILSYRQALNALNSSPEKDRAVRVGVRFSDTLLEPGPKVPYQQFPRNLKSTGPFFAAVELQHGLAKDVPEGTPALPEPTADAWEKVADANRAVWNDFWGRSGVILEDPFLEQIWYRNQYFFNCVVRPGNRCPGLYGNWMNKKIGTVWHGEYVFDYNVQQLFWAAFSSNHVENHLPYVDLIDFLLPINRAWAKNFYELPGAFWGQVHWPVETPSMHKPWFGWGNHLAPVPWAVQSLWWHYLYTMDETFLRERAFEPIKACTEFMNAYMRRPDAHGPNSQWKDSKFHIYPTQSPEIWPEHFGKPEFSDDIASLALTRFLFKTYLQACQVLELEAREATLMGQVKEVLANMPDYATGESPRGGKVLKDVAGASPDAIYNVPNPLMPVFPGEDYGLHSSPEILELTANTYRNQQNEGANDLVFMALQGARLGLLDLEAFKTHVRYCLMPNGTCTDLAQMTGGRFDRELFPYDEWARVGVWVENFSLPGVINECLLQSYTGELRLFPNWKKTNGNARFQTLRAAGAFLVSAEYEDGKIGGVQVTSEAGRPLRFVNPWPGKKVRVIRGGRKAELLTGEQLQFQTSRAETIALAAE